MSTGLLRHLLTGLMGRLATSPSVADRQLADALEELLHRDRDRERLVEALAERLVQVQELEARLRALELQKRF